MAGPPLNVGSTAVAQLINSTDIQSPSLTASMLQRPLPVQPTSSPPGGVVGPPPAAVIAAAMPFPLPVRIPFPPGPPPLPPNAGSTLSLAPPPSLQRQHCYLCDLPRAPWALLQLDYSEPVCRGCVNYEGADRVESAIESARRLKQALGGFGSISSDRPPSSSQCRLPPPHAVGGNHRPTDDLQTRFPTVRAGLHSDVRPPVMRPVPSDIGLVQQPPQHRRDNVGAPAGGIMAARSHYQNGQLRSAHLSSTSHSSDCTIRTQPTAVLPGTSTNGVLSSSSSSSSSAALSSSSKIPSALPPPSRFSIPGFSALDVSNPLPLALIRGEIPSSIQNGNRSSVAQRGMELSGQMVSPTGVAAGPLQLTTGTSDSIGNSETAGGAAGYDRSSPTLSTTRSRIIVETLATLACSTPFDVRLKMEPAVVGRVLAFDANRPGSDQDPLQLAMYVELPSGTGMIYGCCGVGGLEPSGNNNNIKRTSSTGTSSNSGTDLSSDDLTSSSAPFRLLEYLHRSASDEWRPLQELLTDAVRQFREPINRARLPSVSNNRAFIPPPSSGSTLGSSSAVLQQQIEVAMASLGGVGGYRGWNAMAAAAAAAAACGAVLPILPFTASGRSTTASVGLQQQPSGHQLLQMYGTTSSSSATTTSALGSVGGRKRKAAELSPTSGNNSSDDSSAFVSSLPTSGFGLANTDSVQSIKRRLWMQSQADALRLALAFPAAALQAAVAQNGFVSPAAAAAALAGGVPLPNTFQRSASLSPSAIADSAAHRRLHRKSGDISDCDRRLRPLSNRSPTRRELDDDSDVEQEASDNSPADGEDPDNNRGGGRSPSAGRTSDTNELQNVRPVTSPRCRLCDSRLEDTHFVQCPSVPAHKFCFPCSRDSIRRQQTAATNRCLMARRRTAAAKLPHVNGLDSADGNASSGDNEGSSPGVEDVDDVVNDDDSSEHFGATAAAVPEVYCPSGERCPLIQDAPGAPPWAFMANEIETILGSVTAPSFRQSSSVDSSRRSSMTPVVPAVVPDEREVNATDSREGSIDEGNDSLPASTLHRRQAVEGHHQQLQQQHQRQLQQPRTVKDVPQNRSESWSAALPTASLVQDNNGSTKTGSRPTSGNGSIKRERDSA